jgi:hypothetical protein
MKRFFTYFFKHCWLVAGFLLLLLGMDEARAQAPAWQTALVVSQATTALSAVRQTATDGSGNVFVAGTFARTVSFGATSLTAVGQQDAFLAKWSPATGQFVWVQQQNAGAYTTPAALVVQGSSVYLSVTGSAMSYLYKFVDGGTSASLAWQQTFTLGGNINMGGLAVSGSNVYVSGSFSGTSLVVGGIMLLNAGVYSSYYDVFVAKLLDMGTSSSVVWAQRAGGPRHENAGPLVLQGNTLYLAGTFSTVAGSPAQFGTTALTSAGGLDVFVAKLVDTGTTGQFGWAQQVGGPDVEVVGALVVSGTTVYLGGNFASSLLNIGNDILYTAGNADVFVARLNDLGNTASFGWAQRAGGADDDDLTGLVAQGDGMYLTGTLGSSAADFGTQMLTGISVSSGSDGYVAALLDRGSSGRFAWAQAYGSQGYDIPYCLTLNGTTAYVGGALANGPASFGGQTVNNLSNNAAGFLAAFNAPVLTASTAANSTLPFTLSPNPARTAATVQLPAMAGAAATLTLTDALGRTLRTHTAPSGTRMKLDLRGLAPGLYTVQVAAGGVRGTQRLVVE